MLLGLNNSFHHSNTVTKCIGEKIRKNTVVFMWCLNNRFDFNSFSFMSKSCDAKAKLKQKESYEVSRLIKQIYRFFLYYIHKRSLYYQSSFGIVSSRCTSQLLANVRCTREFLAHGFISNSACILLPSLKGLSFPLFNNSLHTRVLHPTLKYYFSIQYIKIIHTVK